MAGHMDEVVDLIDKARRGAEKYGLLLTAALLPEPVVPMLKMYINTYNPENKSVALRDMQHRLRGTENVGLFGVVCIPVPNLAGIYLVLNGVMVPAKEFIMQLDSMKAQRKITEHKLKHLPPGAILLENDNG